MLLGASRKEALEPHSSKLRADGAVGTEPAGQAVLCVPYSLLCGVVRSRPQGTAYPAQGPRLPGPSKQALYLKPNTLCGSCPGHDSAFQEPPVCLGFVNLRKEKKGWRAECGLQPSPASAGFQQPWPCAQQSKGHVIVTVPQCPEAPVLPRMPHLKQALQVRAEGLFPHG